MRKFCLSVGALLALVVGASSESLDPKVLLLARIKAHMREELAHIPNYTCLENIARFHKDPGYGSPFSGHLKPLDSVLLEIVYSNRHEWYGSPGERNLSVDNPIQFVGSGMIGDGAFAITLNNILEGANLVYQGEEIFGGRATVRYNFRLSRRLKGLQISIVGGIGTVGERGSFWADPSTLDLIHLESHADEIPPYLPLAESSLKVNYARTQLGASDVLLAQQADLHMLETSGVESYDRIEFTHCRAFSAESALRFDQEEQEPNPLSRNVPATSVQSSVAMRALPALLLITVKLTTPITYKDPVGKLIEGQVYGEVRRKGKVIVPDGWIIRGRIRRLERFHGSAKEGFIVGLEFTQLEVGGESLRFYADLLRMDRKTGGRPTLSEKVQIRDERDGYHAGAAVISLHELPGVASFFIENPTFTIPSGFWTVWRTRSLLQ